jgi:hypothetical protein
VATQEEIESRTMTYVKLRVKLVKEKLVQHRLRLFVHIQRMPVEAPVCSVVIRRSSNEKRDRRWPNLIWEESIKRDLKDWCITKKVALDRREWTLAIHVPEPWSSVPYFLLSSVKKIPPIFTFCLSILLSFLLYWNWFFLSSFVSPLLFQHCFIPVSLTHVVSSLVYPNLLEIKRLGCYYCCCCISFQV